MISIIIPTYNYAHFLGACIESVLSQGDVPRQIVVVDDGSTDGTERVVARYQASVEYERQDNSGLSNARNRGITLAKGDYLLFLDADDLLGKDTLGQRYSYMGRHPDVGIAVCQTRTMGGRSWSDRFLQRWNLPCRNLADHLYFQNIAPPHAFLVRRGVVDDVGAFDPRLHACEDYDYWLRAVRRGWRIMRSPGHVYYRRHGYSMSADARNQLEHDVLIQDRVLGRLQEDDANAWVLVNFLAGVLHVDVKRKKVGVERSHAGFLEDVVQLCGRVQGVAQDKNPSDFLDKQLLLLESLRTGGLTREMKSSIGQFLSDHGFVTQATQLPREFWRSLMNPGFEWRHYLWMVFYAIRLYAAGVTGGAGSRS